MSLICQSAKISASSNENRWGGCCAENNIFVLLEITGDVNNSASYAGPQMLETILDNLHTLTPVNMQSFSKFLVQIKETNNNIDTLILGYLEGDQLLLGSIGNGIVYIRRGEKSGKILSYNDLVRGTPQAGDMYFFCSNNFNEAITPEDRSRLFSINEVEQLTESAAVSFLTKEELTGSALLVIKIEETVKQNNKPAFFIPKVNVKELSYPNLLKFIGKIISINPKTDENTQEIKSRKILLGVSFLLIIFLSVSVFINLGKNKSSQLNAQLAETLNTVTHQYDEAVSLTDLNPVRSRELLSSSKISLAALLSKYPKKTKEYQEINDWLGKVSAQEVIAYRINNFTSVPLFFDLAFIKPESEGTKIVSYKDNMAILDGKNKAVYFLSLKSKQSAIIAGSDTIKDALSIAIHGKDVYLNNADGIVNINVDNKTSKIAINKDSTWGEIADLAAFGGNIYFIDKTNNNINKYVATDFGFSQKTNYLNPDVKANLSSVKKLIIDGSVWVLLNDGQILKFDKGLGAAFSFQGLSDNVSDVRDFYTSDSEKYIYLLDNSSPRILLFDKDGNYNSQYQWSELTGASGIVANEEQKKIFVLVGSKIYAFDIK